MVEIEVINDAKMDTLEVPALESLELIEDDDGRG